MELSDCERGRPHQVHVCFLIAALGVSLVVWNITHDEGGVSLFPWQVLNREPVGVGYGSPWGSRIIIVRVVGVSVLECVV